jgi:hypothetical protein
VDSSLTRHSTRQLRSATALDPKPRTQFISKTDQPQQGSGVFDILVLTCG